MKKYLYFLQYIFIAGILVSCSPFMQKLRGSDELIKPGDKIGEMIVEQGSTVPYQQLWKFCNRTPDHHKPGIFISDCDVPQVTGLDIDIGWFAKETKIEPNWDAIAWALYIDGYKVDLDRFDWHEFDFIAHGEDNKARVWIVTLKNLSPGKHTLRNSWESEIPVDDGFDIYPSGTYEQVVNFTVSEKAEYPIFSSTANIGQHPYTSEKAQLDFLFYLPDDYGKEPQQEWPLIIYLHGAPLRGATLELLTDEPLPRKMERENNFPFIVVSPLGDGEYEFWAEDEMINSLFILLEEIQSEYSVNAKRIYLTGNDMGGNGVWAIGLRHPEYFAALAPITGYFDYPFDVPENICNLKDVPIWAFHGGRDQIIPVEAGQALVDALVACGGNTKFTLYQDMNIDVQHKVYADSELYKWFLLHTQK